jgi:hypothetical protein
MLTVILLAAGCNAPIIESAKTPQVSSDRTDGAVIGYYLPRALWTFTAAFDNTKGALSISADALPKIVPDTAAQVKYLSYGHAALSDDTVDIQLDGLLLKSVASTSSDQTAKAVEAFNSLLTEVGTAKSAFNAPRCCRTCSGRHSAVDGPGMHVSFNFGHRNRSLSQEASATAT